MIRLGRCRPCWWPWLLAAGKVLASTVAENAPLMAELFGARPCAFKPSIPHLVYQYNLYSSWTPRGPLAQKNPELHEDE